jgi:hypothetical protein
MTDKKTSKPIAKIGAKAMKTPEKVTNKETKSLGASVVSQSPPKKKK